MGLQKLRHDRATEQVKIWLHFCFPLGPTADCPSRAWKAPLLTKPSYDTVSH